MNTDSGAETDDDDVDSGAPDVKDIHGLQEPRDPRRDHTPSITSTSNIAVLPNAEEGCQVCHRDVDHANILLCEACDDEYHIYCLDTPLQSVPKGDWFCGECLVLLPRILFNGYV